MGRNRITVSVPQMTNPISRAGLHDVAADSLRQMIVEGELEPGARLGEKVLSEVLGISRTPLRESFKLLAAEGLVDLVPNKGARVACLDPDEVRDLFEAAAGIERSGAELAAERLTRDELERLDQLQGEIEDEFASGNRERYFRLNQDIHQSILAGSKNDVLVAAHRWLFPRLERARYQALQSPERWRHSVSEHRDILLALKEGDAQRAGQLLSRHVLETGRSIIANFRDRSNAA
ncbi:GntR family transcriptional regulator [Fulvimarina sp. 2208YS6-2-32]|uniref:GntR family transcriptional regulator n=1 Tax=Fulvimarina uroteuthidis TaxID=3098149 RepID=A0ABU5I5A8_9HYPH|nr:GntR family transcriptional regulator [Fulvimarina sp. 2208YS6-2-32]MDY8109913.1 GntR family transcriptional regulator [Fulvimarina sp. 2208YS6-2-32]